MKMSPQLKKSFIDALSEEAKQMQLDSEKDAVNGPWMRAAVATMVWVGGNLSRLDEIDAGLVNRALEEGTKNIRVREYACAGFDRALKKLEIN